uniref:Uncharacterized protein n=1 Tax=Polysiphonia elongata TaxID=159753 RepID=A0A1Z1MBD2_9FLOR|nr:hypothetical protein [Polysiphonia elongata]ARW63397.1 hypothetical protein [Polysiphonia elongata]
MKTYFTVILLFYLKSFILVNYLIILYLSYISFSVLLCYNLLLSKVINFFCL